MLKNYLKIVFKTLMQKKFFSALNLFGISTTVMIIMIAALIFDNQTAPKPPEVNLDRMLFITRVKTEYENGMSLNALSLKLINKYLKTFKTGALTCTSTEGDFELFTSGRLLRKKIIYTDYPFWSIYQFDFLEGRPFNRSEFDQKESIIVISESLRKQIFKNGPAIGKTITLRMKDFRVVGVVKDVSVTCSHTFADAWAPYTVAPGEAEYTDSWGGGFNLSILPLQKADQQKIIAEIQEIMRKLNVQLRPEKTKIFISGPETSMELYARGYSDHTKFGGLGNYMAKWIGVLLLFMLLPSINLMSLNITRIRERASEIAVRKAFGASRRRLFNQLLAENIILTLTGGLLGLVMAVGVMHLFTYQLLGIESNLGNVPIKIIVNYYIFGLALLTCFVFGILSGVLPALKMSKMNPAEVLKGGSK